VTLSLSKPIPFDPYVNARAAQKGQQPTGLWFTGLSGSGKSTIANLVDKALFERGHHTYALDGDNVRHGLNRDLGFTKEDRIENIRRIGEVAKLMSNAGLIVMCSFISPYRAERQMVRDILGEDEFFEIFIDTPLAVAEERDVKGLYKRARAGEIKNFTGIDSEYQPPVNPDLRIDTTAMSPDEAAEKILVLLRSRNRLDVAPTTRPSGSGV
jgi:bifunctional enzyme CysN/CysC